MTKPVENKMTKYIAIIIICVLNSGCNNHLEFDLQVTGDSIKPEIKSANLYIQVDNCKDTKDLDKALQNSIITIQKKDCYITSDGVKAEYEVPLTITNNWLNVDSISIISNRNTFLTIKIPYKTIKLFKDKINYYLANYPLGNEYPEVSFDIRLKGNKSLILDANAIYYNSTPIAHGTVTLKKGKTSRVTLSEVAVQQLFNTGQVTILSK